MHETKFVYVKTSEVRCDIFYLWHPFGLQKVPDFGAFLILDIFI